MNAKSILSSLDQKNKIFFRDFYFQNEDLVVFALKQQQQFNHNYIFCFVKILNDSALKKKKFQSSLMPSNETSSPVVSLDFIRLRMCANVF